MSKRLLRSAQVKSQIFHDRLATGPSFQDFIQSNVLSKTPSESLVPARLPSWLRTRSIPDSDNYKRIRRDLRGLGLHTVCEEARCNAFRYIMRPNISECWGGSSKLSATATIMLMGDICTRGCRFCSVKTSATPPPLNPKEPVHTAEAIARWGLGYIVLTSVDRDDLKDGGAAHFAETIIEVKKRSPNILIEALTGDFGGQMNSVATVVMSGLDVFAHNLETVETLTPHVRDRRATFRQSLSVLEYAKICRPNLITKTSFMLGIGETEEEIKAALKELRKINVDIVTFGQYMRPTKKHMKVYEYVHPDTFEKYKKMAENMGFMYIASGPLVRSSYKAGELFIENILRKNRQN